jgi:hypothetical protein
MLAEVDQVHAPARHDKTLAGLGVANRTRAVLDGDEDDDDNDSTNPFRTR